MCHYCLDADFRAPRNVTHIGLSNAVEESVGTIDAEDMSTVVVSHDPQWKGAFSKEASAIRNAFFDVAIVVHHIGSTAIPGILAKPIIDLLGEVNDLRAVDKNSTALERLGYETMGAYGIEGRRYFRKINSEGVRTHHLHVFELGSPHVERHLAFRDYLTKHADIAAEYSALKERLARDSDASWEKYADGKDPFVTSVELDAVEWYRQIQGK